MQTGTPTKNALKRLASLLLVCGLVTSVFAFYLVSVGIPKTQARNLYNKAQHELENQNSVRAIELLQAAYAVWPEEYILQELESIQ